MFFKLCVNRKGISPLIAAVLLTVVVVGLGAAVISLSKGYFDQGEKDIVNNKEAMKCGSDVSIDFVILNDNYAVCNTTDPDNDDLAQVQMFFENTGAIDVLDAQVRMIGTTGIFQNNSILNEKLVTGETVRVNVTYDPVTVGDFKQVKIVPRISLPNIREYAFCSDSGITVNFVPNNCTTYR